MSDLAAEPAPNTLELLAPFTRDVLLATGRAVRVRPAEADDVVRLREFYDRLGDTSTYYRFFGVRRYIPEDELRRATDQDVHRQVTLLAEADGVTIGVGEYHGRPDGEEAEVAFAVSDDHHNEGVATVLLEDLALIARAAGYRRLVAEMLPGNARMRTVFRTVGLVHRSWFDSGTVQVQLDLAANDVLQDHADLRDWRAGVQSLQPILHPEHVVVIGAGRDATKPGRRILVHLQESFQGRIDVVHPTLRRVGDVDAVAAVHELDATPDLAIIAVPAPRVTEVVDQCGSAGVLSAVVASAGFAELGDEGARMQDDLLACARRHGMRIVGPNCLGVVCTSCGLNATFTSQTFTPGGIAVASQSGGVGIAIAAEAQRRHVGISSFVSMGNKIDVSGNDLLRFWADDPSTRVVLLYLESIGDPLRFARVARAVSQRKPVVALTSGWTAAGGRGAASHTAALATDRVIVDALLAKTGVVRARTLDELIDVGLLLDRQPAPAGRRVALIGNGGGPLILGADAAAGAGLDVPVLSPRLQAEITHLVPTAASAVNPVDLSATVCADRLAAVVDTVGASGEVDAVIVVCVEVDEHSLEEVGTLLDAVELDSIPLAVSLIGSRGPAGSTVPRFPTPERAANAVALAVTRAEWLTANPGEADDGSARLDSGELLVARRVARRGLASGATESWLDPVDSYELLEAAGLPIAAWRHVRSADECAEACTSIGPPCVVKADVTDLLHKSDEGAVLVGLTEADAARAAYRDLEARFGDRLHGALVQAQVSAGVELLIGIKRDARFGPLLVVGAGGVDAELRDDRKLLVAPVSRADAARAVEGLRLAPLFHGFRGRPALPMDAVIDVVHRVGMLAAAVPEIQQLDLNPVLVGPNGCVAVDVLVSVAEPPAPAIPVRGLRGHRGVMP